MAPDFGPLPSYYDLHGYGSTISPIHNGQTYTTPAGAGVYNTWAPGLGANHGMLYGGHAGQAGYNWHANGHGGSG
jgi:hypothetical protein